MATPAVHREVESQDEEFLHHLRRGADLLARGELEPALASLHRARDLRPRDPQVLGLLGQTHYKQGHFDLAAEAYQRLVDESPLEASARVNLGLSHLKARRFAQAVRQFEVVLDLSPGHKKAMGYLGLAWLDQGDPVRARDWFERAGSAPMATRCEELIAAAAARAATRTEPPAPPAEAAPATVPAVAPGPAPAPASPIAAAPAPTVAAAPAPAPGPAAATGGAAAGAAPQLAAGEAPAPAAPDRTAAEPPPAGPSEHADPEPHPEAFAGTRAVSSAAGATFALERGILTVSVRRDVVVRAQGLLAVRGAVRLTPEMKRFRGRPTEKSFGEGARRMLRASGDGALLYAVSGSHLARFELAGEAAYYREDLVFAFEDSLAFENGRVASRAGPDLHLVQLNGHGQVLLATSGDVVTVDVARDVPVRVRLATLLGWTGALTPKVGSLARGFASDPGADAGDPPVVELAGVGRVLLDQGAAA